MNAIEFPQANAHFGPPAGMNESQVKRVPAFLGVVTGGSVDGSKIIVVAWQPTAEELADLNAGNPVFVSMMENIPPHFLTTRFEQSTKPA